MTQSFFEMLQEEEVILGFGSNMGDPLDCCFQALGHLCRHPDIQMRKVSSFYSTEPVGYREQSWFINGVLLAVTSLTVTDLLGLIRDIEHKMGRVRLERWGPRIIDLDILFFGDHIVQTPDLTVPHPRLHERRFVLEPLVEIHPRKRHPLLGRTAEELLRELNLRDPHQQLERLENVCFVF